MTRNGICTLKFDMKVLLYSEKCVQIQKITKTKHVKVLLSCST